MEVITKSLAQAIKNIGRRMGFTHVGITSPDAGDWTVRLRDCVNQGYHGEMQ